MLFVVLRVGDLRVSVPVYHFSETVPGKRLEGQTLSESVVDTARPPQCEFSNVQFVPLTILLEFLCWPVIEFF